jgi:tetratricopeptide (TPR) repeat protein/transcriptional regulator with XRE-family HTH domain
MRGGGRRERVPDLAALLRSYRLRAGMTQEELAQLSGLSVRTVRNLEVGRTRPYRDSLRRLADALRLPAAVREHVERVASLRRGPAVPETVRPPNQLPPDAGDFTGRAAQVAALGEELTGARTAAPGLAVVSGRAGVGKTALSVHVAHLVRGSFGDGQLFANLRGADARPREPAEVLASFLHALGVDGREIPDGLDARLELYRLRLAERRVLVVLDNAAGEGQVRPLLPGSPTCAVLITARARLTGLAGARRIELDMLAPAEAVQLLGRVTGAERTAAEPAAAWEIVRLCDRLPLALRIAGARLSARPHWQLGRLAARLLDERHRLDELVQGDLEVRASIEMSYNGLDQLERRTFRRLGLLDAPDFAAWVAAPLLEAAPAVADELVERLCDAQLLESAGSDTAGQVRFRFHDLLRLYARERAAAEEPEATRTGALRRALAAWRGRAERAEQRLVSGGGPPDHTGSSDPLAWFDAERHALATCVTQACEAGLDDVACGLAAALATYLNVRGDYDEWLRTHQLVLAVARRRGNRLAEGVLLRGLGDLHMIQDRYDDALGFLRLARPLLREAGDRRSEAAVLNGMGFVLRLRSSYPEALACFREALAITSELGDDDDHRHGLHALHGVGSVLVDEGRFDLALACYESALSQARAIGYRMGEAVVLRSIGILHRESGRLGPALAALEESLARYRELGSRPGETHVLLQIGELRRQQGRTREARAILEGCLSRYREYGDRFNEAMTLWALGEVAVLEGRPREATAGLHQAVRTYGQLRLPLWQARALRSLAAAYESAGKGAPAAAARRHAEGLLEELSPPRSSGRP